MIEKKHLIKELNNIKLVIGNGFDLHCGLKTRYDDFFNSNLEKNDYYLTCIEYFRNNKIKCLNECDLFWNKFQNFDKANIWDFYFYLYCCYPDGKKCTDYKWCDIEDIIRSSLYRELFDRTRFNTIFTWENVWTLCNCANRTLDDDWRLLLLATFALKKSKTNVSLYIDSFYEFVLRQLNEFEKNFAIYIERQHNRTDGYGQIHNSTFDDNARKTVDQLCDINKIVEIDSFNFDSIGIEELEGKLNFINGFGSNPIFGVDTDEDLLNDSRINFTKTSRRIDLDMLYPVSRTTVDFENVIIYGHSLNKNDYNYFFALLDKLEMTNIASNKKIVFGYTIFDETIKEKIKQELKMNIFNLFKAYAIFKGYNDKFGRLLDTLTSHNRVVTYEISPLYTNGSNFMFWY